MVSELCRDDGKIILMKMSNIKYNIEFFDGNNNFSIWQSIIKDIWVQQELLKVSQ